MRRRRWMELETRYIVEKIIVYWGDGPMLREATFVLKGEGNPSHPDFRVWNGIGSWFVYAHDNLMNHREWSIAEARGHFQWVAAYLELILASVDIEALPLGDIGIQYEDEPMEEDDNNEINGDANMEVEGNGNEVEEEEEEEDLEEDPNWANGEEVPPAIVEEHPNHVPTSPLMNFDQDLQIPDSNRVKAEHEQDPTRWRDVYEISEYLIGGRSNDLKARRTLGERSIEEERLALEERMQEESREMVEKLWNEAGNEMSG